MRIDYNYIALDLLYNGTVYQKKCMRFFMDNFTGKQRMIEIRRFIECEYRRGRLEV